MGALDLEVQRRAERTLLAISSVIALSEKRSPPTIPLDGVALVIARQALRARWRQ